MLFDNWIHRPRSRPPGRFVWADGFPHPVAMVDYTAAGASGAGTAEVFYYLRDALGSVVALADASGTVVERYWYDPYGTTYIYDGAGATPALPCLTRRARSTALALRQPLRHSGPAGRAPRPPPHGA
jgi:hypothetical protein